MNCEHQNFVANVAVGRLTKDEDGPVTGYVADVRIECADCGRKMQFLGLPTGYDTGAACVSVDGLEARLALCPQGQDLSTLDRIGFQFRPEATH